MLRERESSTSHVLDLISSTGATSVWPCASGFHLPFDDNIRNPLNIWNPGGGAGRVLPALSLSPLSFLTSPRSPGFMGLQCAHFSHSLGPSNQSVPLLNVPTAYHHPHLHLSGRPRGCCWLCCV